MSELGDILKSMTDIFNIAKSSELVESKLIANQNKLEYLSKEKELATENNRNFQIRKSNAVNKREEQETILSNYNKLFETYGIVAQDITDLDDKDKTPEGKSILDSLGIQHGENFRYTEMEVDGANNQINATEELVKRNNTFIDILGRGENELIGLSKDLSKIKSNLKNKYGKDVAVSLDNIQSYMVKPENRAKFGIDENKDEAAIDFTEDTNYLGQAFQKGKDTPGDTGFYDANAQVEANRALDASLLAINAQGVNNAGDAIKALENTTNLPTDDEYLLTVGKVGGYFPTSVNDIAKTSPEINRRQKMLIADPIIAGLKYGEVGESIPAVQTQIDLYDNGNSFEKEQAIYNIHKLIVGSGSDVKISKNWGYGFKKGSGMKDADFQPNTRGYGAFFGDSKIARKRSNHTLGMLKGWMAYEDMYPEYRKNYNDISIINQEQDELMKTQF